MFLIKSYMLIMNTSFSFEFLNTNLENNFVKLRAVNEDHKIEALRKLDTPGLEIR